MSEEKGLRHIVRVANTDIIGEKQVVISLQKIKGVGHSFANMICKLANVVRTKKAGALTNHEVEKLDKILSNPKKAGVPDWMLNRQKDYETGEDKHLLTSDLQFQIQNDKKRLQKIKSYRGLRLVAGLPVRGQRTKSNFRKKKGKTIGVKRKK